MELNIGFKIIKKHREDGPAVTYYNGGLHYYFKGNLHREDGPAKISAHGCKEWYINNKRHRNDGPAVIWPNGSVEYWINGAQLKDLDISKLKNLSEENDLLKKNWQPLDKCYHSN